MDEKLFQALKAIMSPDNHLRIDGETYYHNQMSAYPLEVIQQLWKILSKTDLQLLVSGEELAPLRSLAGVLLRRAIEKNSDNLPIEFHFQLRDGLLSLWQNESLTGSTSPSNKTLLKRIGHIIAQSAAILEWNTLVPSLIRFCENISEPQLIPTLNMFEILCEYSPDELSNNIALAGNFLGRFICSSDLNVQLACAKATGACIASLDSEDAINSFKPAVDPILNVIGKALSNGMESDATCVISHLVSIAQIQPLFFKDSITNAVNVMIQVVDCKQFEFSTRSMALEMMITLCENAPSISRKCKSLIQGVIPLAMSIATEMEETEAEWEKERYIEDSGDDYYLVGDEAIERLAVGLGGKVVSEPIFAIIQQYFSLQNPSSAWKCKRAAVAALCRLAEGASKHFLKHYYEQSLSILCSAMQNRSQRVIYEAIQAVGQFAALYTDKVKELVPAFLPTITNILSSASYCDRVRGHSASALINMMNPEFCEVLQPFVDPLLNALVLCLQTTSLEIRAPCLTIIGCIAQVCSSAFIPYYSSFMPGIKSLLQSTMNSDELITLRGKAMECAGLVGEAVGVEIFAADALEIMQILIQSIQEDNDPDYAVEYIFPACARISKALGGHFEPYLPMVLDPILKTANQTIQFTMEDADDDAIEKDVIIDEENGTESAVVTIGAGIRKRVTLNTPAIRQINQSARILYDFAENMKGYLKGYSVTSLETLLRLVTEKHSSDIRSSASLAVSKMFDAYMDAIKNKWITHSIEQINAIATECLKRLLECTAKDINSTSRTCAAESFRDVLNACYESGDENEGGIYSNFLACPSLEVVESMILELLNQCGQSLKRRQENQQRIAQNEGLDAEDKERSMGEELEIEEDLLSNLGDSLGIFVKLFGSKLMPTFKERVSPAFSLYLSTNQPVALQIIAVSLFDDIIEFGGNYAHPYIESLLPILLNNAQTSSDPVLRQCSVYGIAKAAFSAPNVVVSQVPSIVSTLISLLQRPDANTEENVGTSENAVFGLGAFCSNPDYRAVIESCKESLGVDLSTISTMWVQKLPLKADVQEAKTSHALLCDGIEANDPFILGHNFCNLGQILRVIAEIHETEAYGDDAITDSSFYSTNSTNSEGYSTPFNSPFKAPVMDPSVSTPGSMKSDGYLHRTSGLVHPNTSKRMQQIVKKLFQAAEGWKDQGIASLGHETHQLLSNQVLTSFQNLPFIHQNILKMITL